MSAQEQTLRHKKHTQIRNSYLGTTPWSHTTETTSYIGRDYALLWGYVLSLLMNVTTEGAA